MPNPIVLTVPRAKARAVLDDLVDRGQDVLSHAGEVRDESSFKEWRNQQKRWSVYSKSALQSICENDALAEEFERAESRGVYAISMGPTPVAERLSEEMDDHNRALEALRSMLDRLELFNAVADEEAATASEAPAASTPRSNRVFVVHGRQRDSADVIARFLTQLGLDPVILDEQANEGRTVLEKLEANTEDVGFAVVLLQADDYGRGPDDDAFLEEPNRARQNVILELGFFVGKLGRARVAAFAEPSVEQPSDILGLAYLPFDESWQLRLARELRVAYPSVDLNRAL